MNHVPRRVLAISRVEHHVTHSGIVIPALGRLDCRDSCRRTQPSQRRDGRLLPSSGGSLVAELPLLAKDFRLWRCSRSAAIRGAPVVAPTQSRRQPVTRMYGPAVRRKRFHRSGGFVVLHQSIRPLIGAVCAPGHHGYQRACVLITGQASNGPFGSPGFAGAGKTGPPFRFILSQTSAGNASRKRVANSDSTS